MEENKKRGGKELESPSGNWVVKGKEKQYEKFYGHERQKRTKNLQVIASLSIIKTKRKTAKFPKVPWSC